MNDIVKEVEDAIKAFTSNLPAIQKKIYGNLLLMLKEFDVDSVGNIKNTLANINRVGRIKKELERIILDKPYLKNVADYLAAYSTVAKVQNEWFSTLVNDFTPKKVFEVVKQQAVDQAADALTETGIRADIVTPLRDIISVNVKSGGSYADLTQQLRNMVVGNDEVESIVTKYARVYTEDALTVYSREYGNIITDDLDLSWFGFQGGMKTTSRPICVAMHSKRFFHRSQFPDLCKGIVYGEQTPLGKNNLPLGFKPDTNPSNYLTNLNGFFCSHQLIAMSEANVPQSVKEEVLGK